MAQGLTLALNMRLDKKLPGVTLTYHNWLVADNSGECGSAPSADYFEWKQGIPVTVYDYLMNYYTHSMPPRVYDLMTLVNDALGGAMSYPGAPNLASVVSAAMAVNEAFDGCMWVADEGGYAPGSSGSPADGGMAEGFSIELTAFPNPFVGQATIRVSFSEDISATIEVYNLMGAKVTTLGHGDYSKDRTYDLVFTPDCSIAQSTYCVVVNTEMGSRQLRIIMLK